MVWVLGNHSRCKTVEGMDIHLVSSVANDLTQFFANSMGSGVTVGQGEDTVRRSIRLEKNLGDTQRQYSRLTCTRTGYHHDRTIDRIDSFFLLGVQTFVSPFEFLLRHLAIIS